MNTFIFIDAAINLPVMPHGALKSQEKRLRTQKYFIGKRTLQLSSPMWVNGIDEKETKTTYKARESSMATALNKG